MWTFRKGVAGVLVWTFSSSTGGSRIISFVVRWYGACHGEFFFFFFSFSFLVQIKSRCSY